jgi:hypothetical protein
VTLGKSSNLFEHYGASEDLASDNSVRQQAAWPRPNPQSRACVRTQIILTANECSPCYVILNRHGSGTLSTSGAASGAGPGGDRPS